MRYQLIIKAFLSALMSISAVTLHGQTRFIIPDTTADYSSYKYIEECMAAIKRLSDLALVRDPVWSDTISLDTFKLHRPLPEETVKHAKTCLARVDVDTVSFKHIHTYAQALLVANRDEDVQKLYSRYADTIAKDMTRESFILMLNTYMNAVPIRFQRVMDLYELGLLRLSPDSVGSGMFLRAIVGFVSARSGDQSLANKIGMDILAITDTLSDKHRDSRYLGAAKTVVYPFISGLMTPEATDSLAKSTEAYKSYLARVWKSVVGDEAGMQMGPYGIQAPQPTGEFWYSNLGPEGTVKAISPVDPIVKGKVTLIHFLQAGCHVDYQSVSMGRTNGMPSTCWAEIHKSRKLLEQYPQINLVVVSKTFGTFVDAPPLTPEQEADTLASYFLGFHKLKGIHVISKTDFIRLAKYDNRKIDSETPNDIAYRFGDSQLSTFNNVVMVDEEGMIFHFGKNTDISEYVANIRIRTVMERKANRGN